MRLCVLILLTLCTLGCGLQSSTPPALAAPTALLDQRVTLDSLPIDYDLYLPAARKPAPLVIVAHGLARTKANMTLWGKRLADEGFVAAVPTLPAGANHPANARAVAALAHYLATASPHASRIDPRKLAYIGLSAGGLATFLAAADNPAVSLWVGLDPVDMLDLAQSAAPRLHATALILRADPSPWNLFGNSRQIAAALGNRCQLVHIPGSNHIDPEWPTDLTLQLAIGPQSPAAHEAFIAHTLAALHAAFPPKP